MLQVLLDISLKALLQKKRHGAMQKLFIKREREMKKWTSVQDIENNGYSDARQKKRKKEDE